jgi:hypothetical protein
MATVIQESTTEEQCSVVRFCGQKDSMKRTFVNKCFLFTVGKCLSRKAVHNWMTNVWLMTKRLKRRSGSG